MEWNWERYKSERNAPINTLHDMKSMSRPGMDNRQSVWLESDKSEFESQ